LVIVAAFLLFVVCCAILGQTLGRFTLELFRYALGRRR